MVDVLEEVLNDQNEEKRLKFFKRLLPIIIIMSIIIIIVMVSVKQYQDKKKSDKQGSGNIFVKSVQIETSKTNKDLAFNSLEDLVNNSGNTRIKEIALLEQVAIKISEKDYTKAKALLEKIIQDSKCQEITAAYARISWLNLVLDEQNITNSDKEKFESYLRYFDSEEKAFWGISCIIKAIWDIKNGMPDLAKTTLRILLTSNSASWQIKDQANALLTHINRDSSTKRKI